VERRASARRNEDGGLKAAATRRYASRTLQNDLTRLLAAHPGQCGIYPLRDAHDAFAARFLLAEHAERTLDVQYYIWRRDLSGMLLFKALLDAAERGVRVRLLLDDNNTSGLDPTLAALDAHRNIEVRLFNPFHVRRPHWIGYLTDFRRLNHRMHNKSFTADDRAAIIGGRNIGDEYFAAATSGVVFADLDVMAIGPVVHAVTSEFERYWTSKFAVPAHRLITPAAPAAIDALTEDAARCRADPAAAAYIDAVGRSSFVHDLVEVRLPMEWAVTRMISDVPEKVSGHARRKTLLSEKLKTIFGEPGTRVELVSPYFVPGAAGVEMFRGMAQRGVEIRVLTNSLEATDVAAVHAGYAKRREALLRAGVILYELRRVARMPRHGKHGPLGSSSSSLHAKTFAADGSRLFIGSFNFDPRSAHLNTEMGFVIDSTSLAGDLVTAFKTTIPENAYEVRLSDKGKLFWIERNDGEETRHDTEPGTTIWRRAAVAVAAHLPIEWLL